MDLLFFFNTDFETEPSIDLDIFNTYSFQVKLSFIIALSLKNHMPK